MSKFVAYVGGGVDGIDIIFVTTNDADGRTRWEKFCKKNNPPYLIIRKLPVTEVGIRGIRRKSE